MENSEQADLGTAQNNSTNKVEGNSATLDLTRLTDIVSKSLLSGEEENEPSAGSGQEEAENPAVEATADEEQDVLSQESETDQSEDSDEDTEEQSKDESNEQERGLPKGVKKRIDKLTSKKREAEAEVERLRSEVERLSQEAEKPAQTPTEDNPYSNLSNSEEVSREIEQAKRVRRWCEMNPDGATVTNKDGSETDYSSEEIRSIKIKALDALEEHLPKRLQYLQNYQQFEQVASKEYPWWKDKAARERQMAESFIKAFPEVKKFPDYKMVIGDLVTGIKVRESKASKTQTITKSIPQPKASASPSRMPQKDMKAQIASKRFSASGSRDDLSDLIASKFL